MLCENNGRIRNQSSCVQTSLAVLPQARVFDLTEVLNFDFIFENDNKTMMDRSPLLNLCLRIIAHHTFILNRGYT